MIKRNISKRIRSASDNLVSFLFMLSLSFCGSDNSRWSNHADLVDIDYGMTREEVRIKIGQPDSSSIDENYWYYGNKWNFVFFEEDGVKAVSVDMTDGRITEWVEPNFDYHLKIDPLIDGHNDRTIAVKVNGQQVDFIDKIRIKLNEDKSLFLSALSSKRLFKMHALIVSDKIEDHSVMINSSVLGGSGTTMFSDGFKLMLSTAEFTDSSKIYIQYEFSNKFGMRMAEKSTNHISVSGTLQGVFEDEFLSLLDSKTKSQDSPMPLESYKKTNFKTFSFHGIDICNLKKIEFTDIFEKQNLAASGYDSLEVVKLLHARGLSMLNWRTGKWSNGPRIVCATYADDKYKCGCHVDKLYHPTEIENEYVITERIDCMTNAGRWALISTFDKHTID